MVAQQIRWRPSAPKYLTGRPMQTNPSNPTRAYQRHDKTVSTLLISRVNYTVRQRDA